MINDEKYLPIGTIVMLKNGKKRIMITGFCVVDNGGRDMYDYCGVLYPEGFIDNSKNLLFNHDKISTIYYKGYIDEEELNFKNNLKQLVENLEKKL